MSIENGIDQPLGCSRSLQHEKKVRSQDHFARVRQFRSLQGISGTRRLLAAAALELVALVREKDVEAGQRAVAAADVTLELHLFCLWQVRGIDMLLERAKPVSQH